MKLVEVGEKQTCEVVREVVGHPVITMATEMESTCVRLVRRGEFEIRIYKYLEDSHLRKEDLSWLMYSCLR